MPLSAKERRQLAAEGHKLDARITLAEADVSDNVVTQVSTQLQHTPLLKVRVNTKDRDVCAAILNQLTDRVQCEVVQRVGRVALLYREPECCGGIVMNLYRKLALMLSGSPADRTAVSYAARVANLVGSEQIGRHL